MPPPITPPSQTSPPRLGVAADDPYAPDARGDLEADALTDLFLGEVASRPLTTASTRTDDSDDDLTRRRLASAPRLRLATDDRPPSDPSTPLSANTEPPPPPATGTSATRSPRVTAKPHRPRPAIEAIVLGHLPVLGSVWAMQYVREVSRRTSGAIGYLRVGAGQASVEMIPAEHTHIDSPTTGGKRLDLPAAIAWAAPRVERWIIRADAASELDVAALADISTVTLLTSADEAARVGAYRAMKELATKLVGSDEAHADADPVPQPVFNVVVMGAERSHDDSALADAPAQTAESLARAIENALDRPVSGIAMTGKLRSTRAPLMLFSGRFDAEPASLVRMLADVASTPRDELHTAAPAREPEIVVRSAAELAARGVPLVRPPAPPPSAASAPAPSTFPAERGPSIAARPNSPASADVPRLAEFIPALTPLAITCPYAPRVQCAADAEGTPHLLIGISGDHALDAALASLMTAASWMAAHAALIHAAAPAVRRLASVSDVRLHVFTSAPKDVRRLLETDIRMHLLARVTTPGGETAWCHTELN